MSTARVNITDRGERYRAQRAVPRGPKVCARCGSRRFITVDHKDGHPDHTTPSNLQYLCKSCNTAKGAAFAKAGRGRLTHQYNPASGEIPTYEQYRWAVTTGERDFYPSSTRHKQGEHDEQGAIIHATPPDVRAKYAKRIARGNPGFFSGLHDDLFGPPAGRSVFGGTHKARADANARAERAESKRATVARRAQVKREAVAERAESKRGKKAESPYLSAPDEKTIQEGFKRGLTLNEILRGNPGLRFLRQSNPAKFDRCVKEVQRKGGAGNAYAVCRSALKRKGKRNPSAASAEVFEEFHGFAPSEVITVTKHIHHHEHLAAAGKLVSLDVWGIDGSGHKISGFKGAFLAFNESKNQLFIEGGDQTVNLEDFGIDSPHEFETLGKVTDIGYQTNKTHLGDEGGQAVYVHKFRSTNENGKHVVVRIAREPDLIYDVRNESLLFSGGSYEILREGIDK